jgi:hypothetical protein
MNQSIIGAVLGALFEGVQLGVEQGLDNQQQALQSREWNRAMRAQQLQEVDAYSRGAREVGQLRMRASQLEGSQRIGFAMGNVDATSGTAAGTISSSRLFSEVDAETARNNARREALGHKTAQLQLEDWGRGQSQARKARDAGRGLRAVGSILQIAGASTDKFGANGFQLPEE